MEKSFTWVVLFSLTAGVRSINSLAMTWGTMDGDGDQAWNAIVILHPG